MDVLVFSLYVIEHHQLHKCMEVSIKLWSEMHRTKLTGHIQAMHLTELFR